MAVPSVDRGYFRWELALMRLADSCTCTLLLTARKGCVPSWTSRSARTFAELHLNHNTHLKLLVVQAFISKVTQFVFGIITILSCVLLHAAYRMAFQPVLGEALSAAAHVCTGGSAKNVERGSAWERLRVDREKRRRNTLIITAR